ERLFKLAQNSANNTDQARCFQVRFEINDNRAIIDALFFEHLSHAFDNFKAGLQTSTDFNVAPEFTKTDTLALVDKNELEEALAIATMSRRASTNCAELLYALNQRLSVLRGGKITNEQENPFCPAVFAEAIQYALSEITLDDKVKVVVFKVFEFCFMSKLRDLFELLNDEFINQGLLPNLGFIVKKSRENESVYSANNEFPLEQATKNAGDLAKAFQVNNSQASIQNQIKLIQAIRTLQAQLNARNPQGNTNGAASLPARQIIAEIQQLQNNAGSALLSMQTPTAVAESNAAAFQVQAEKEAEKSDDIDANAIIIVGLLFEFMLDEQQLPDTIKTLLSYLHTPFLKIALQDKEFFDRPEHPARQLLNSLVAAGEYSIAPSEKNKGEVFQKIKSVVQRLLDEYNDDVRLFSELAFEFNSYLRQYSRRSQLTEKRSMQAAQGETKLKEIRLKIETYLKTKTGEIILPSPIKTLLFEPWANFLSFNLLRYGSRSDQWKQATQVVDDILWYCQPHDIKKDFHAKKRVQELQLSLPPILYAGFDMVGYDNNQGIVLLQALHNERSSSVETTINTTVIEPIVTDIEQIDISKHGTKLAKNDALVMKLKTLKPGVWFDFNAKSTNPLRAKLAWMNNHTLHFMFVNSIGQQVALKSAEQLASEMRSGEVRVYNRAKQKPFFEKAMERALEQLEKKQSKDN
ncbi:MAG: hypothetical protein ACI89U_002148, partial [Gammaproteobacteria bacterium]